MFIKNSRILVVFLCFLLINVLGCDRIQSFIEKKLKKSDSNQNTASQKSKTEGPLPKDVLIRIGDWSLTIDQFNERLNLLKDAFQKEGRQLDVTNKDVRKGALNDIVMTQVIVEDAIHSGMLKEKEIQDLIEDAKRTILYQKNMERISSQIQVTPEEAKQYFDNLSQDDKTLWHLREIVVDSLVKASELQLEIAKNEKSFEDLAKENSLTGKENGGDLGFLPKNLVPEELLQLEEGDVSTAIEVSKDNFHIFKLEEVRFLTFDEVQQEVIQRIKMEKFNQYVNQLRKNIKVETNESLL